jgi:predicted Zn finger-like uncharacterized protein
MWLQSWMRLDQPRLMASLQTMGFRKWYERQLVVSHGWMAFCFICIILMATGLELFSTSKGVLEFLADSLFIAGALIGTWIAWRQYAARMVLAEAIGVQAHCLNCGHYGFRIDQDTLNTRKLTVRCTKCAHRWPISQYEDA